MSTEQSLVHHPPGPTALVVLALVSLGCRQDVTVAPEGGVTTPPSDAAARLDSGTSAAPYAIRLLDAPEPPPPGAPYEYLPVSACDEPSDGPRFEDATSALGVDFEAPFPPGRVDNHRDHHIGGGAAIADVTGDDWPDLVLTSVHGSPALFVAKGDGGFERRVAGFEALEHTISAYAVDLDGDGWRDLVFTTWDGVHPFRNLADGTFERRAPLLVATDEERPTFVSWTDFDGDGDVDAYVGIGPTCFVDSGGEKCSAQDRLLRGLGDFAFEDQSDRLDAPVHRSGLAMAGSWQDLDRDGDLDMLVGNDSGAYIIPNRVFLNPGLGEEGSFVEGSAELELNAGMAAMGVAFADPFAEDERLLVVSNVLSLSVFRAGANEATYARTRLEHYFDIVELGGLYVSAAWAVELEDLDNDGDRDLFTAWSWLLPSWWWEESRRVEDLEEVAKPLPPTLWLDQAGVFEDASTLLGDAPRSWTWRTLIPVDLDRDGALDLVMTSLMGPTAVLMGRCPEGHWLSVDLRQSGGNTEALGAMVEVSSPLGVQRRRIGHGSTGAQSGREAVAHFGLAGDEHVDLRVVWPDGEEADIGVVTADRRVRIHRDRIATSVALPPGPG